MRGCVPKKLFVHAAHFAEALEDSVGFGWTTEGVSFDWPTLRDNVAADVDWLSGIYIRNLETVRRRADPVAARCSRTPHTRPAPRRRPAGHGALHPDRDRRPAVVDRTIPGIEHAITSNEMFHLERLPRRMLIVGGGYIAVEFAGVFNAFGVETTIVHRGAEILRGFDGDIRRAVHAGDASTAASRSICGDTIASIEKTASGLVGDNPARPTHSRPTDPVRHRPPPEHGGFGLEEAGVALGADGAVVVDDYSAHQRRQHLRRRRRHQPHAADAGRDPRRGRPSPTPCSAATDGQVDHD